MNLKGAFIQLSKKKKNCIEISTGAFVTDPTIDKRTYIFRCDDAQSRDEWLQVLMEESSKSIVGVSVIIV